MRDICVDLETISTDPYHGAIVQIGAVKFDLFTGEVGETFSVALKIPKNRFWSEGTRSFWGERLQLFNSITENAVEPKEGFTSFIEWVQKTPDPHFWAKPITFDFNWIQSYCDQYDIQIPFAFWKARDLRSFMLGVYAPEPLPRITMKGSLVEHDALSDALSEAMWAIETYRELRKRKNK